MDQYNIKSALYPKSHNHTLHIYRSKTTLVSVHSIKLFFKYIYNNEKYNKGYEWGEFTVEILR